MSLMKYTSTLPATALFAVLLLTGLVHIGVLPPGMTILKELEGLFGAYFFALIFIIILLESIVYVGFYFPGQFFAVVLVILSEPSFSDVTLLTVCMVSAATLGSMINYLLGNTTKNTGSSDPRFSYKSLLLAMIHMNSLAFFMFNAGVKSKPFKIVWMAGLINLPYYLALIVVTATLSEEIMQVAESTWLLATIISIWLAISVVYDVRQYKQQR